MYSAHKDCLYTALVVFSFETKVNSFITYYSTILWRNYAVTSLALECHYKAPVNLSFVNTLSH
jgi:hypothetical protein